MPKYQNKWDKCKDCNRKNKGRVEFISGFNSFEGEMVRCKEYNVWCIDKMEMIK